MDLDSYTVWERRAVSLLTQATLSPAGALDVLEEVTTRITRWRPGSALLHDVVQEAFATFDGAIRDQDPRALATDRAVKRWLAARLFGSWTAYQGDGLIATVRHLRACLDLFTREVASDGNALEAIRRSDVRILHTT